MPEGEEKVGFVDTGGLREKLERALEEADQLRLEFVGIKISEALDAIDTAEMGSFGSRH